MMNMEVRYRKDGKNYLEALLIKDFEEVLTVQSDTERLNPKAIKGKRIYKENKALVMETFLYALNRVRMSRTRNAKRKKLYSKQATEREKMVKCIVGYLEGFDYASVKAWCSYCLELSDHYMVQLNLLRRDVFICNSCGYPTAFCRAPGCANMAKHGASVVTGDWYCAEHDHSIPSFRRANMGLKDLSEWKKMFKYKRTNLRKITATVAIGGIGVAVFGPTFCFSAPAIGGAVGAWTGLSGAAATSHGLALLGLGSLAAGGYGMAGGAAVVTAVGTALGASNGARIASAYYKSVEGFKIRKLKKGSGPGVIVVNGFLSEGQTLHKEWETTLNEKFRKNPWYLVEWESKELIDLGTFLTGLASRRTAKLVMKELAKKALKRAVPKIIFVYGLFDVASLVRNPWHVAVIKARQTAVILSSIISRIPRRQFYLVGNSLGALVCCETAKVLSTTGKKKIKELHMLGAAVSQENDWHFIRNGIEGNICNYFSK